MIVPAPNSLTPKATGGSSPRNHPRPPHGSAAHWKAGIPKRDAGFSICAGAGRALVMAGVAAKGDDMAALVDPNGPALCILPSNPVPEGARVGFFKTSDGVQLRYALWPKGPGAFKGTICLVQGRAEFIEKYFETIEDFRQRGFAVAAFDWRGQGGSDRLIADRVAGYVERFEDYWVDLKSFHSDILLPECQPPFYLVGHSMGGLVSLMATVRDRLMFDRVFLNAPMLGLDGQPLSTGGMAVFAETLCLFGLGQMKVARKADRKQSEKTFPGNALTSDFSRYMRMVDTINARPELEVSSPTVRWAASAFRAMARAAADDFPERISVPVLMLAAAKDEVVSTAAIEHLGLRMRTGRHLVVPAARHEMFVENDQVRAQLFAAFDAFITDQTGV